MIDGVARSSSYRDQWANNLTNDSVDGSDGVGGTQQVWNAVFTDQKENNISVNDFLSLMVAQLRNQDFMNPVDDTQYVTQLAQFSTMQQMQEMATYMKTNYVMSLVGKNVTAAKITVSGELQKETGVIEKISLVNNEYAVYVNGKKFSLEQIMEINSTSSGSSVDTNKEEDPTMKEYLLSLIGKEVTVRQRDEDGDPSGKLTGVVEKISTEDGEYRVYIDGNWYPLADVLEVGREPEKEELVTPPVPDVDQNEGSTTIDPENPENPVNPDDPGDEDMVPEGPSGGTEVPSVGDGDVDVPDDSSDDGEVDSPALEGDGFGGGEENGEPLIDPNMQSIGNG